jgi:hypothetical protein
MILKVLHMKYEVGVNILNVQVVSKDRERGFEPLGMITGR